MPSRLFGALKDGFIKRCLGNSGDSAECAARFLQETWATPHMSIWAGSNNESYLLSSRIRMFRNLILLGWP